MHTKTYGTLNSVHLFTRLFHKYHLNGFKLFRACIRAHEKRVTGMQPLATNSRT